MNLRCIIVFTIITAISAVKQTFEGYKVFKATAGNIEQVNLLNNVRVTGLAEIWEEGVVVNQDVKIMVSPGRMTEFHGYINGTGIEFVEVISDVQRAIDNQRRPSTTRSSESYLSMTWNEYHNLAAIYSWLDELERNHPGIVKTVSMGRTLARNEIKGIVINYHPEREKKLIAVIEGTLHAREWISPATVTWIVKEFLTSTDPEVRALAENFEWHVFPVVNPDGYEYTFTDHRMWRKNRNPRTFTSCAHLGASDDMSNGVDLNRNFGFVWNTVGASNDPCTNTFAGPFEFSELEAVHIRDYMLDLKDKGELMYYLSYHSYTQLIIVPYSHVTSEGALLSGNYADMFEIAARAAEVMKQQFGFEYRVGLSDHVLYPMSGTSFDWVKYATNIPVSYLIELRDLGEFGFLLPPDQIIPTAKENLVGLLEMDKTTRDLGYYVVRSGGHVLYSSLTVLVVATFVVLFG